MCVCIDVCVCVCVACVFFVCVCVCARVCFKQTFFCMQAWLAIDTDGGGVIGKSELLGPNLEPGTVRGYVINGSQNGVNIGR